MTQDRYLLCKSGCYAIAVHTEAVQHIGEIEMAATAVRVDLRALLKVPCDDAGVTVVTRIAAVDILLIVESVAHIETIADSEFMSLPAVFEEANSLFDGACRRPIGGGHPLRLRLQPLAATAGSEPL